MSFTKAQQHMILFRFGRRSPYYRWFVDMIVFIIQPIRLFI